MAAHIRRDLFKVPAGNSEPEAQCHGKQRFASVDDVAKALRRFGQKKYRPYRCPYCDGYHLGGGVNPGTRQKRIRN